MIITTYNYNNLIKEHDINKLLNNNYKLNYNLKF